MAGFLSSLFKKFPTTQTVENYWVKLNEDYNKFVDFEKSEDLLKFNELDEFVNSDEFKSKKAEIEALTFQGTDEQNKETEYLGLKKDSSLKLYFKTKDSSSLERFQSIDGSEKLNEFQTLKEFVQSPEFEELKRTIKFENTQEYTQLQEYLELKNSSRIKNYYKLSKSKLIHAYNVALEQKLEEKLTDLEKFVNSDEFLTQKNELNKSEFSESEAGAKFKEYSNLKKNKDLKGYLKFKSNSGFTDYLELAGTEEITKYEELDRFVNSSEFKEIKANAGFEKSDAYQQFTRFKELKKDSDIKFFLKYGEGKEYKNFLEINDSEKLARFVELEDFVNSDTFKEFKQYMLDKKKFEKSDEYAKLQEYNSLVKSEQIVWYLSVKAKNDFEKLVKWDLVFEDKFENGSLDDSKWMTKYFWGDAIMKGNYSLASDFHANNGLDNIDLDGKNLSIVTKKENVSSKVWDIKKGFYNKEFEYSSGLISSGHSFRQQYGKFVAKVKADRNASIYHGFWLVGEKIMPHIDVVKFSQKNKKKVFVNYFNRIDGNLQKIEKKVSSPDTSLDYYIYTLEWTPEGLKWYINDVLVQEYTGSVPEEPMYLVLSSGLNGPAKNEELPAKLEIDWVRCYKMN